MRGREEDGGGAVKGSTHFSCESFQLFLMEEEESEVGDGGKDDLFWMEARILKWRTWKKGEVKRSVFKLQNGCKPEPHLLHLQRGLIPHTHTQAHMQHCQCILKHMLLTVCM